MSIPFPTLHIATSVLNRIQNTLEEIGPLGIGHETPAPAVPSMPPIAPDPLAEGAALTESLQQPPEPVAVPPEEEVPTDTAMLAESVTGGSPFDGALL